MIYIIFTNKLFHYLKEKVIVMRKITLFVLLFTVVGNFKGARRCRVKKNTAIIRKELLSKSDTSRYHCQ